LVLYVKPLVHPQTGGLAPLDVVLLGHEQVLLIRIKLVKQVWQLLLLLQVWQLEISVQLIHTLFPESKVNPELQPVHTPVY
jgi:hypothetical protein